MRAFCLSIALLGTLALASAAWNPRWIEDSRHWISSLLRNEAGHFDPSEVEASIAAEISSSRERTHQCRLDVDGEVHAWLRNRLSGGVTGDLENLAAAVQSKFPNYVKVAACTIQGPSIAGLLRQAADWAEQSDKSFTHAAIVAWPRAARLGFECVAITGEKLPTFEPELLTRGKEKFFAVCSLCGMGQPCEFAPRMRSVSLECPHCHRVYAILAIDTKGRFHHVNEFLTGYAPPAHFPPRASRMEEMLFIWRAVVQGISYVPDSDDGNEANDAWQTAGETQQLGRGDCEDASIFLADWLMARGFEARLAVGRYAERGGHAWVVVRLAGETYLLEATNPNADMSHLPLASKIGSRYVPDATIDREGFYTRKSGSLSWNGDYWSGSQWLRVRAARAQQQPEVTTARR